ncbi:MAG: phosphohistidine phosphatase SixA, partial [Caldiserica bacterium]
MRIYLVQHAEAKPKEEDPERPLTEKGVLNAKKVAEFLKGKIKPSCIYHSDKLRAKQTAKIFSEILGVDE